MEETPLYKKKWFIVVAVVVAIALIGQLAGSNKETQKPYAEMTISEQDSHLMTLVTANQLTIKDAIEQEVKKLLKAPDQASFSAGHYKVDQYQSRQIYWEAEVSSPNDFGAKIKNSYRCVFSIDDQAKISILKISLNS